MSSYRPIDSKREEFRKYLEKAGALDALTKVLVMLYEETEKPADALEYVRKHLGDNRPDVAEIEALRAELEEANVRIHSLEDEKRILQERLSKYEPVEETEAAPEQDSEIPEGTIPEGTVPTGEAAPLQDQENAEV